MTDLADLRIKIFADGADLKQIEELAANPLVKGFTTNPSLCRKAGVTDYEGFARAAVKIAGERPISFEVFADDLDGMERQARIIAGWGENVYVKVPITNTKGVSTGPLLRRLSTAGVKLNVTAIFTNEQLEAAALSTWADVPKIVSIFMGRINDTGTQPRAFNFGSHSPEAVTQTLWASTREIINIWQANAAGFDIITVTPDLLSKLSLVGKDLDQFSLETVQMFYRDAVAAGYTIADPASYGGVAFGG